MTTRRLLLAAALAALTGCPRRVPPADLSADPAALEAQIARAQAATRSVQGEARVRVSLPEGSGTVQQFIAAEKPDRLHVEALDFFGNQVAVLVAAGGRFALYDARARTFYRGPATPENLARLVPLPLRAEDLVEILCGGAPLLDAPARSTAPGAGYLLLELGADGRRQVLRVGEGARVERSELTGAEPAYALRFDAFQAAAAGVRFPYVARLEAPARKVDLEVRWKTTEVNVAPDPALFRLEPPRGARVMDLEEAPAAAPPNLFETAPPAAAPGSGPGA